MKLFTLLNKYTPICKDVQNIVYASEYTIINDAARNGDLVMVKLLHSQGNRCSIDMMDWAVYNGHTKVVKWLQKAYSNLIHSTL